MYVLEPGLSQLHPIAPIISTVVFCMHLCYMVIVRIFDYC